MRHKQESLARIDPEAVRIVVESVNSEPGMPPTAYVSVRESAIPSFWGPSADAVWLMDPLDIDLAYAAMASGCTVTVHNGQLVPARLLWLLETRTTDASVWS